MKPSFFTSAQMLQFQTECFPTIHPQDQRFALEGGEVFTMQGYKVLIYQLKEKLLTAPRFDDTPYGKYELEHGISEHRRLIIQRARQLYQIMYQRPHAELYAARLLSIWLALHDLSEGSLRSDQLWSRIDQAITTYQERLDRVIASAVESDDAFYAFIGPSGPLCEKDWYAKTYAADQGHRYQVYHQNVLLGELGSHCTPENMPSYRSALSAQYVFSKLFFSQFNDLPIFNTGVEFGTMIKVDSDWNTSQRFPYDWTAFRENYNRFTNMLSHSRPDKAEYDCVSEVNVPHQPATSNPTPPGLGSAVRRMFGSRFGSARQNSTEDDPMPLPPRRSLFQSQRAFNREFANYETRLDEWRLRHPEIMTVEPAQPDDQPSQPDSPVVGTREPQPQDQPTPDPGSVPLPQSSQTPDDDGYVEPNSQPGMPSNLFERMKVKARDYLDDQRLHPNNYRNASHFRRFNDSTGTPQTLRKSDIRSSDIVVKACNNRDSLRYVLTFGGEDRHPIFNVVHDSTWTKLS